jgi:hypothetical protein
VKLRLFAEKEAPALPLDDRFDQIFDTRIREAGEFYSSIGLAKLNDDERNVVRQAYAGLLWSKQFYHYIVQDWLNGDPEMAPPESRQQGRNIEWQHIYSRGTPRVLRSNPSVIGAKTRAANPPGIPIIR